MGLVGMLMRQKRRIEMIDAGIDQLLAQIGRGVNDNARDPLMGRALDQQRTTAAAVLRIGGIAFAPAERRPRHACRRAAAENGEHERHAACGAGTLENRRKKFSVVCRDISSSETLRVSASTLATSTT